VIQEENNIYESDKENSNELGNSGGNNDMGDSDILCSIYRENNDILHRREYIYRGNISFREKNEGINLEILCEFLCRK